MRGISFRNVDLILTSREQIHGLVSELESKVTSLGPIQENQGEYEVVLEVLVELNNCGGPDALLLAFCDAIEGLSKKSRSLWDRCERRVFDIGYDSGIEPWHYVSNIGEDTILRIAKLRGAIAITIYGESPSNFT